MDGVAESKSGVLKFLKVVLGRRMVLLKLTAEVPKLIAGVLKYKWCRG
jgi:hypothetical protein